MMSSESLRGYGKKQFERDRWTCRYCGLDCSQFELWLFLCLDHIIPKQQQDEANTDLDDPRNYATACRMCNGFGNRTKFAIPKNVAFEKQVASVFDQKKKAIIRKRAEWYDYWSRNVKPKLAP
jgi:5-methylcytosine-specific restriction endonuclease McrA